MKQPRKRKCPKCEEKVECIIHTIDPANIKENIGWISCDTCLKQRIEEAVKL